MLDILSTFALAIITTPRNPSVITINFIICAALYFFVKYFKNLKANAPKSVLVLIIIAVYQSFIALRFHRFFTYYILFKYLGMPNEVMSVFQIFRAPVPFAVFILDMLLALLSAKIIYDALSIAIYKIKNFNFNNIINTPEPKFLPALICAVSSFTAITICSKSSFLYPFNDWVDVQCFITVGKSMMRGIVPYRDLLEQKGPLLYLLHGLAWVLSPNSFEYAGIYLLELIAIFLFLLYSYKIMRLYINNNKILFFIPALALSCCVSNAFAHGDSAEELCLPLLAASLYIFLRAIKAQRGLSHGEALLIGVLSGCIFWIKFTITGLYAGWYVIFAFNCIKRKKFKNLFNTSLLILCGVLIATLPFVIYFALNHALYDWLKVYILDNIFLYGSVSASASYSAKILKFFVNMMLGFENFSYFNTFVFYLCCAGFIFIIFISNRLEKFYILSIILFAFIFTYVGGVRHAYYSFSLCLFSVFGLILIYASVTPQININLSSMTLNIIICAALALLCTPNRYFMLQDIASTPQYQFAKIINQAQNPTLLNYGSLDGGFYTAANIYPNCKASCILNISNPEMKILQDKFVKEGLCDYVVIMGGADASPVSGADAELFNKYELISQSHYYFEDAERFYYLYKLKDL